MSCSHDVVYLSNIDPKLYTDNERLWKFRLANMKCESCNEKMNGIQRTCIDHNITQPWDIVNPHYCKHDIIRIINISIDAKNNKYSGRALCFICKVSVPVTSIFTLLNEHRNIKTNVVSFKNVNINMSHWIVNRSLLANETKIKIIK